MIMKAAIETLPNIDQELLDELLSVWEASVRATHDFLTEADVERIGKYVPDALLATETMMAARNERGRLLGFCGVTEDEIEMLFVDPAVRGSGIGSALVGRALEEYGASRVDVNEQNGQAVGFYEHMGFKAASRSETDGMGDPFPIVHMRI